MSEQPMEEWRRRAYLEAMGVTTWERRARPAMAPDPVVVAIAEPERPPSSVLGEPTPPLVLAAEPERSTAIATAADAPTVREPAPRLAPSPVPAEHAPEPIPFIEELEPSDVSPDLLAAWDAMGHPPASEDAPVIGVEHLDWDALEAAVANCRACRLWEGRTKTVFGVGDRRADLMLIGEAPGADEDRQGEPFVGRAGQLLNRMLAAIGFARDQVYIANVLKCRPPGNRDPKTDEALQCQAYLMRQVALIQPRVILAVGRISAQQLLQTDTPVGRLRGRWFEYGPAAIPLRVTYHPAYLLRSPEQKAKAWEDLTEVKRRL